MSESSTTSGPDFSQGVLLSEIPETGVLAGHVGEAAVLLARVDGQIHAVSGSCTHYGGPLGEGLRVGDEIRCPWHNACFNLRTGKATKAPAFAPLACWNVEVIGDKAFLRSARESSTIASSDTKVAGEGPKRIVIIGGGAAGFAAAERLRKLGYNGTLTMLSADESPPCDRPNLSKDYLAGTAPEEWIPLQPPEFYTENKIDLRLNTEVISLDTSAHRVETVQGEAFEYDALLLATGAEPNQLPGFDFPNVFTLRTLSDSRALIAGIAHAKSIAIIGAGFIGLEAACALRARGLEVHVIAPETLPLARIVGDVLANYLLDLHRTKGVIFHLDRTTQSFDGKTLQLSDGTKLEVDAVLVGVGVKPRTALAASAGLAIDNGIRVNGHLHTSAPGVFAAGDVASYLSRGEHVRVEHWVHAERQGQVVAANMLGASEVFEDPPFFWTHHYGTDLRYVGHGRGWNSIQIESSPEEGTYLARYFRNGTLIAAAAIGQDKDLLCIQTELEKLSCTFHRSLFTNSCTNRAPRRPLTKLLMKSLHCTKLRSRICVPIRPSRCDHFLDDLR